MRAFEVVSEVDKIRALNVAAYEVLGGLHFETSLEFGPEHIKAILTTVKQLVETASEYAVNLHDCLTTSLRCAESSVDVSNTTVELKSVAPLHCAVRE